jgi:hypothetical protein
MTVDNSGDDGDQVRNDVKHYVFIKKAVSLSTIITSWKIWLLAPRKKN